MVRKILNDAQWARIAPELPGKKGDPGKSGTDNRLFVEAVLWVARTGSPWRDLPAQGGDTKSGYRPLARRLDDQDRGFGGRAWKLGALHLGIICDSAQITLDRRRHIQFNGA